MKFCVVDAFTDTIFKGNPAAVCVLKENSIDEAFMQNFAAEINISESAFVFYKFEGVYSIRWFTPKVEVSLCGHATLAAAHVLWNEMKVCTADTIRFESASGDLFVCRSMNGITLNFPAHFVKPLNDISEQLVVALGGAKPLQLGVSNSDWVAELNSAKEVIDLVPNFEAISALSCRAIVVTARNDSHSGIECDFVSRFFAPKGGVAEDPVTGSAHCKLATYWSSRLDKSHLLGYQASKRGGFIKVHHEGC